MCRVVSRSLGAGADAPGEARAVTRDRLHRWELDDLVVDATLLVSELVTNALLHAQTEVVLTLAVADGTLEVGVADGARDVTLPRRGRREPARHRWPEWAESGRGLRLLDTLADQWGVADLPDGKQVWFRMSLPAEWPYRTACPCGGADLDATRLSSGARALAVAGPWDS